MLGPLLFLLHINDLPNIVTSQVRLFADDCLLYRPIRSVVDQEGFQRDLEALEQLKTVNLLRQSSVKLLDLFMGITGGLALHIC